MANAALLLPSFSDRCDLLGQGFGLAKRSRQGGQEGRVKRKMLRGNNAFADQDHAEYPLGLAEQRPRKPDPDWTRRHGYAQAGTALRFSCR